MKAETKRLLDMVKKGIPDKELMKELGVQTRASLRRMYYDALVEAGKIKDIMTERQKKKVAPRRRPLSIGKRGTILLGKPLLVDQLGFKKGDRFSVAKRKDRIILKKVAPDENETDFPGPRKRPRKRES